MTILSHINIKSWPVRWQSSTWMALQGALGVAILLLLATAVYRYQNTTLSVTEPKTSEEGAARFSRGALSSEGQPLSFYEDLAARHDIFRFEVVPTDVAVASRDPASPVGMDFSSRYIVQGIISDKDPQVIIKDTQGGKTYFMRRTEILNGATLVDIRDNHVIFNFAGEALELIKK